MYNRKGFTLLEVLIVLGIFSIVSIISIDAYFSGFKAQQNSNIQNIVIQDARYILGIIAEEISNSEIDYEEYFSQCVIQGSCPNQTFDSDDFADLSTKFYGLNHGYYSWQFFNGGVQTETDLTKTDGYGSLCQGAALSVFRIPDINCISSALTYSEDSNTGVNPNTISLNLTDVNARKNISSAVCSEESINGFTTILGSAIQKFSSQMPCTAIGSGLFNELYLLNKNNGNKVVLGKKIIDRSLTKSNYAIAKLELEPIELQCSNKYLCGTELNNITSTDETLDLDFAYKTAFRSSLYDETLGLYSDFVPISPLNVNIKNLKFYIDPLEDPFKAYRESGLTHPTVTIILEIEPSTKYKLPFFSSDFNLKLQTTVAAGLPNQEE
jgi:prepilin-type N-terminal cleavage/methylation domain-containing protein